MSVLKKIFTAIRGGVTEVGETVVDANSIRIFEQEIRESKEALTKAKKGLAEVMAKEIQAKRKLGGSLEKLNEFEGYAIEALNKNEEQLALEIAEKIAELEIEVSANREILSSFHKHVEALKQQVQRAEKTIAENQRQLAMVKTTESVQKATMAASDSIISGSSSMVSAKASLERIKQRQAEREDQLQAEKILESASEASELKQKMQAAGIGEGSRSEDILARLKSQQN